MRVGEAVGFPGIDGQGSSVVKASGLRVLALVTEAFGGRGGIAQYNRDFLGALARCDGVGDVTVLAALQRKLGEHVASWHSAASSREKQGRIRTFRAVDGFNAGTD